MKRIAKILSLVLILVLVTALTGPAMATDGGAGLGPPPVQETYTITAPGNGHTYEIYQIFTGNLSAGVLTNVKWGQNGTGETGTAVAEEVITALTAVNSKSEAEKLAEIEKLVDLNSTACETVTGGNSVDVAAGYYLIKDVDGSVTGQDSYTLYITQVVGDVTINPKSKVPTFQKKVKDINDSTDTTESGWQDSADHDIGDQVKFQLTGTVAENFSSYKGPYYFSFRDQQSPGLTFDDPYSVTAYVDGNLITDGYDVNVPGTGGCTFEIWFDDLKNIVTQNGAEVKDGSVITVEYTATLNENAVIGSAGNPNQAKLVFSNNPNWEGEGTPDTGETPWDKVIVFTYKTVVNKVDGDEAALAGAAFKLEKWLQDGYWETVKEFTVDETTTEFEFVGLDDGKYKLTETVTPSGYNSIDPIEFTVTAEHVTLSDNPSLTSLSGNVTTGEITFTSDVTAGSLSTQVINQSGATLPSTGGVGTTMIYILGSALVLVAVVLLVTKKRMEAKD